MHKATETIYKVVCNFIFIFSIHIACKSRNFIAHIPSHLKDNRYKINTLFVKLIFSIGPYELPTRSEFANSSIESLLEEGQWILRVKTDIKLRLFPESQYSHQDG